MIVTFLASQRISLHYIDALLCVVPVLMLIFLKLSRVDKNTFLILALFLSIDNGGDVYSETPSLVRYGIYIYAIIDMFLNARFHLKRILLLASFALLSIILAIINLELFSLTQFKTDIIVLLLLSLILCTKISTACRYEINFNVLVILVFVFLMGELLNIFANTINPIDYLNYNSLKSLIIFPSLYFLVNKKFFFGIILVFFTTVVLLNYGSRMILLIYIAVLVGYLVFELKRKYANKIIVLISGGIIALILSQVQATSLEHFKFVNMILSISAEPFSLELVRLIDPVRFGSMELFFDRNFFEIFAGSGYGVGLNDVKGVLDFVRIEGLPTAFADYEIYSGLYFNFHDLWTDVGLRFGLGPLLFGVWLIARRMYVNDGQIAMTSQLLLVLVFCAFFSTAGLILIALISLSFRRELYVGSKKNEKN